MTTSGLLPTFDRFVELAPGERAVAVRNIAGTLPVFATHFPRHPILPGVLLLESMIALAKAVVDDDGSQHLRAVQRVRFTHFVSPGDQVFITVEVTGHTDDTTHLRATAQVEGKTVATARRLTLGPATESWKGTS
jgi:3-hydroxyacyl-[acyl-carrier-protein] dehydratase